MGELKLREPYKLGEIIRILADKIKTNGIYKNLDYDEMKFCLYTKEYTGVITANLVCYLDDYPDVTDDDEEVYPLFALNEKLDFFCDGVDIEDVIGNSLHQNPSVDKCLKKA